MCFLEKTSTIEFKWDVFHPSSRAAREWGFNQWLEDVPDFIPDLSYWSSERPWMLCTEDRYISVVVYRTKFRSPPEQLGEPIREEKLYDHAESRRPRGHRAEWSPRPISLANELSHLSAACKTLGCGWAGSGGGHIINGGHPEFLAVVAMTGLTCLVQAGSLAWTSFQAKLTL